MGCNFLCGFASKSLMTDGLFTPGKGEPGIKASTIPVEPLHVGSLCPNCGQAKLDYNGLLELECSACGYRNANGAGCT
jgi:rubredoxin